MLIAVSVTLATLPALAEETSGQSQVVANGEYRYTVNEDGTASIYAYDGSESELTIPSALDGHPVTAIGQGAFSFRDQLITVVIPDGVTSIGSGVFSNCSRLRAIEVSENNPNFSSVDGVLFDKEKKTLLSYPGGKGTRSYEIPAGTTAIGDSAIYHCDRLTSVSIPDSVLSIGYNPFTSCVLLKKIDVSEDNPAYASVDGVLFDKVTNTLLSYPCARLGSSYEIPDGTATIGDSAFAHCKRLTGVVLPDSVTAIGRSAFWGCDRLSSIVIPQGVTSIKDQAFYFCRGLTSVSISDSVISIGEDAFGFCEKLSEIIVSKGNPTFESIDGVLFKRLPKILKFSPPARDVTHYEIPWDTDAIGNGAFRGNRNLTSVVIPYFVTSIGDYAFTMCDNLVSVTILYDATSIGEGAFDHYKITFRIVSDSRVEAYLREHNYIAK